MVEMIAKKYTKAIVESMALVEIEEFLKDLRKIQGAFYVEKFLEIIRSPYVSKVFKERFVIELVDTKSDKLINVIKLLTLNNRLEIIPFICSAIQTYINQQNKKYIGLLFLSEEIELKTLEGITQSLSKRLKADLSIRQVVTNLEGIKLVIDDLNLEISFSRQNFLSNLRNHILKAI